MKFETALTRYRSLLRAVVSMYFAPGLEDQDLEQEARIGLWKACTDYDERGGANFHSFARLCVERQVITAVKTAQRKKHGPLNGAAHLDAPAPGHDDSDMVLADVIADPGDSFRKAEALHDAYAVLAHIAQGCSELEHRVAAAFIWDNASYEQIGELLGVEVKAIDNAIQRVRRKLLREGLVSERSARVDTMGASSRAKEYDERVNEKVRALGARVADPRAHPELRTRIATPEELEAMRKRGRGEEQPECAACGLAFMPAEGRRRDPAIHSLYVHVGEGCERARRRAAALKEREEREALLGDETTNGRAEMADTVGRTAAVGREEGQSSSQGSAPSPSEPPRPENRGRASRDEHGGRENTAPRGVAPILERPDLPADRIERWEELILDPTGSSRDKHARRARVVEEVIKEFGPRSSRLLEVELPFPDAQSGSICRALVQRGVLRKTRLVRDWPRPGRKPSPEYEWVPENERQVAEPSEPPAQPGHDDVNAGTGQEERRGVESPSAPAEPSLTPPSDSGAPEAPAPVQAYADELHAGLLEQNRILREQVLGLEAELEEARELRATYERDPRRVTDYIDLLFEHCRVHPEHEHIFDRVERLLELPGVDRLIEGKHPVRTDTVGG